MERSSLQTHCRSSYLPTIEESRLVGTGEIHVRSGQVPANGLSSFFPPLRTTAWLALSRIWMLLFRRSRASQTAGHGRAGDNLLVGGFNLHCPSAPGVLSLRTNRHADSRSQSLASQSCYDICLFFVTSCLSDALDQHPAAQTSPPSSPSFSAASHIWRGAENIPGMFDDPTIVVVLQSVCLPLWESLGIGRKIVRPTEFIESAHKAKGSRAMTEQPNQPIFI